MAAITSRNWFGLDWVAKMSNVAHVLSRRAHNVSGVQVPVTRRERSRFLSSHFPGSGASFDVGIPVTGLPRNVIDTVLNAYQTVVSKADRAIDDYDVRGLVSVTDPRLWTGSKVFDSSITELAVVFRITVSSFIVDDKEQFKQLVNFLSVLDEILELGNKPYLTDDILYRGQSIYQYRGLPINICPAEELWEVSGVDYLRQSSGVLEWCTSKEDAEYIISNMQKDGKRFNVSAQPAVSA